MSRLGWLRRPVSIVLILWFSCTAWGADDSGPAAAMLFASGNVRINGVGSRETTALFAGDSVQTDEDAVANITAGGSSVLVMPGTFVKFLKNLVELDRGGVAIATTDAMSTRADDLVITPVSRRLSKFEVAESEEFMVIAARQGDVLLVDGMEVMRVPEGQQRTRRRKKAGVATASGGHVISSKTLAIIAGASVATAVAVILITQATSHQPCVSPSGEKQCK
jgi:ribosome-associated protein YbcJ (S4-like RNA binding protein)